MIAGRVLFEEQAHRTWRGWALCGVFTVLALVATGWVLGRAESPQWALLALALTGPLLIWVDMAEKRLPDLVVVPFLVVVVLAAMVTAVVTGEVSDLGRGLLGALVSGVVFFVLFVISPAGIGFGDVKLAPGLGLLLVGHGWSWLFVGLFVIFLLGALQAVVMIVLTRRIKGVDMPFGPAMVTGTWVTAAAAGLAG